MTTVVLDATPKQMICGEEMHPLITLMASIMASNMVNGLLG